MQYNMYLCIQHATISFGRNLIPDLVVTDLFEHSLLDKILLKLLGHIFYTEGVFA